MKTRVSPNVFFGAFSSISSRISPEIPFGVLLVILVLASPEISPEVSDDTLPRNPKLLQEYLQKSRTEFLGYGAPKLITLKVSLGIHQGYLSILLEVLHKYF